jgi:hypothetical protein
MALREYIENQKESLEETLRRVIREELQTAGKKGKRRLAGLIDPSVSRKVRPPTSS